MSEAVNPETGFPYIVSYADAYAFYHNECELPTGIAEVYAWATVRKGFFTSDVFAEMDEYNKLTKEGFFTIPHG